MGRTGINLDPLCSLEAQQQVAASKPGLLQPAGLPKIHCLSTLVDLSVSKIYILIKRLLDDDSPEEVLIFDDSTYDRNRSKKVELLAKVFDPSTMKFLKGFRLPTLDWSDG